MNNKGQTLVAFVLIVPAFIMLLAFVVDTGFLLKESTRLNSVTKTILKTTFDKRMNDDYEKHITNLYIKNDISLENIEINTSIDEVKINNYYHVDSIFGKIIGLKEYKIKLSMIARNVDGKVIVTKE